MFRNKAGKYLNIIMSFFIALFLMVNSVTVLLAAEENSPSPNQDEKPVFCFLGSSVTLGHTTGGVSFVDYLARDNGWICIKRAVSGTTLVDNGPDSYVQRMIRQLRPDQKIDYFVCQLSTNDATQRKPLGTVSESRNKEDFDTSTITGAMEYIIAYAYETWDCPVFFYTNPYYNNRYYESMIEALYKLQEKWGINIIDFYNYKDMEPVPREVFRTYMSDPIHPNANGYRWMADVMSDYFKKYMEAAAATPEPSSEPTSEPGPSHQDEQPKQGSSNNYTLLYVMIGGACVVAVAMVLAGITLGRKRNKE